MTDQPSTARLAASSRGLPSASGLASLLAVLLLAMPATGASLDVSLTSEQLALLGCGPFYGTSCTAEGFGLLDAEASVVFQDFPGESRFPEGSIRFDPTSGIEWSDVQLLYTIPGSMRPTGVARVLPRGEFTAQELAALSFDALLVLVDLSDPDAPRILGSEDFAVSLPLRPVDCSFRTPESCSSVRGLWLPTAAIPEPGAVLLFATGFALVVAQLRRRPAR